MDDKAPGIWNRIGVSLGFIPPAPSAVVQLREGIASSGRPIYSQTATHRLFDWLGGVPDPDEVLKRTGRTRASLREILRDAEVTQALDTRKEAVLATPWRFENGDTRAAKFVEAEIRPHSARLIAALWDCVPYGYSVVEAIYARRDGRIGIDRIEQPAFEWFRPMPGGGLRWFPEDGKGGPNGFDVGPGTKDGPKFLLTSRNGTYRNPYGESLLSVLYWPVTWRMQGWQLWLDFLDTYGAPIMVGKVAAYKEFVQAMVDQGVRRAVGFQAQAGDSIEAITASSPGEFERLEGALNRMIQRTVLGQTLTSDTGKSGGGSYALGKVHEQVRDDKRRADIRIVSEAMQRLVGTLWELNGFPGAPPLYVMQDDVGLEAERAARDVNLHKVGVRFEEVYFEDQYDLEPDHFTVTDAEPVDEEDEDDEDDQKAAARKTAKQSAIALGASRFTPSQQVVERGIRAMVPKLGAPLTREQLRSAMLAATDRADLEHRLGLLLDAQDPRFAEMLARAAFACDVLGYVHSSEETVPSSKESE